MEEQFQKLSLEEKVVSKDPSPDPLWEINFGHGKTNFRIGRFSEALTHFEKTLELEPSNSKLLNAKACALHEIGRI
jgi:Flp pilus assembly protein TadD